MRFYTVLACGAVFACSTPVLAQRPANSPLAVDLSAGYAIPVGEFAGANPGIGAEAGPHLGFAVLWRPTPVVGGYAGYSRTWFGCTRCGSAGIEDQVIDTGTEAGVELSAPGRFASPWVRAGVIVHQLVFSDGEETLSSEWAMGYAAAAGVALGLTSRVILRPALRYRVYSAGLDLGPLPDEHVLVAQVTAGVILEYRF